MAQKIFKSVLTKVKNNKIQWKWMKLSFKIVYYCEILLTLIIPNTVMISVIIPSVISPSAVKLSVVMLSAIIMSFILLTCYAQRYLA